MEESKKEERRKTYRSAKIDVVANGFIITIGCQTLVAGSPEALKCLIVDYLNDPIRTEKVIMRDHLSGNLPVPVPVDCYENSGVTTATANHINADAQVAESPGIRLDNLRGRY